MKIRLLLCTLALAVAPGLLHAQPMGGDKEPETELGKHMEKISGAFRRLRKVDAATKMAQIADPAKNEDSLKQLATIKENAEAASKLEPAFKEKQPADKQEKFMADFHDQMKNFLADIDSTIAAVKAGNNEEAAKLVNKLNDDQHDGHKEFRPPPKKRNG